MTRGEIKTEILVRSGKDTTSAWTSEAFLNDWINQYHKWAAGYKPWPWTEGRTSTTYAGSEELSFEGYKADSFRIVTVGGKVMQKIRFEDYLKFKQDYPSKNDRVFSDFGGVMYVNTLSDVSGTMTCYGQYVPAEIPDGDGSAGDDANTVFTPNGDEGNQAIIESVLANLAYRDLDKEGADIHKKNAVALLDVLWGRVGDEQYAYQAKNRTMFEFFDVQRGGYPSDIFNRDQFGFN